MVNKYADIPCPLVGRVRIPDNLLALEFWGGGNGAQFIPPHPSFTMHSHTFPQVKLSRPTMGAGNRSPTTTTSRGATKNRQMAVSYSIQILADVVDVAEPAGIVPHVATPAIVALADTTVTTGSSLSSVKSTTKPFPNFI